MTKQIWAPWRIKYILGGYSGECLFCDVIKQNEDKKNYILERHSHSFVMFNLYPYNNGHLMIAPYRHVSEIEDLSDNEMSEIGISLRRMTKILKEVFKPEGFNIGINIGKVAGAGFDGHIHYHIVPRWNGDTNFMPVISDTKILSESLNATYDKMSEALSTKYRR